MTPGSTLQLPVRWWGDAQSYAHQTLALSLERTAFVLVDCDGPANPDAYDHRVKTDIIAAAPSASPRQSHLRNLRNLWMLLH